MKKLDATEKTTWSGIDTAARITVSQARKCAENGISWVGRYLVPEGYGKALTAPEAQALRDAGLAILLCWEIGGSDMKAGAARGSRHGAQARQIAEALGVPPGSAIYFAADWDVQSNEMSACVQYMAAAQAALGQYYAGVYGGEAICRRMAAEGYRFIWQCVAWTKEYIPQATATQYAWQGSAAAKAMAAATGILAVDLDRSDDMKAAGMWLAKEQETIEPWYVDTVRWAEKEGVISPVKTIADARPEDSATRAEVMQMIRNYNRRFEAEDDFSIGTKE